MLDAFIKKMLASHMVATPPNHKILDQTETASSRLHAALDLMEFGIELMRGNIKRRMPLLSPTEIAAELQAWIEKPSGSEFYDKGPKS